MKLSNNLLLFIIFLAGCTSLDRPDSGNVVSSTSATSPQINYGHNIIVAIDMSNRILKRRRYEDPTIIKLITDNLKPAFQKSIDLGINGKFYLTTINDDDFKNESYSDSVFKIDLNRFKTNAVERSNYLYHNDDSVNSLRHDVNRLNVTFEKFYQDRKQYKQLPADMWYFFRDKLTYPVLDTASFNYRYNNASFTTKYKNYIIVLTDGYIEAGRYGKDPDMRYKNQLRFFDYQIIDEFRNRFNNSNSTSMERYFKDEDYGILPVNNLLLKDSKVLVLELFDRSIINGVASKSPKDMEVIKLFWSDWLRKSGCAESNIVLKENMSNTQDLNTIIKRFLEIN